MKEELVEIKETWNKEGYLIKRTTNGVPFFVPKQDTPSVQIITPDTEWVQETIFMTKEEFENRFKRLAP